MTVQKEAHIIAYLAQELINSLPTHFLLVYRIVNCDAGI